MNNIISALSAMPGLGTIINVAFIVIGGTFGVLFGNRLREHARETLLLANAVAVLFIGTAGALQQMYRMAENGKLEMTGTMMMIGSLAAGAVIGEWIDLEEKIERFGEWLKSRTGNAEDAGLHRHSRCR